VLRVYLVHKVVDDLTWGYRGGSPTAVQA